MTTPALRLRACPRCDGALTAKYDEYGGYWNCIQCGFHSDADVPLVARIARPEAMAAHSSVFTYSGPDAAFKDRLIMGRLLPAKKTETVGRYDLACPYEDCARRQLSLKDTGGANSPKSYQCKNDHRIKLDLKAFTWV